MVYNSQPVNIEFLILIKGLVFLTLYSFCSVKHVWYHGLALSFTVVIEMNFQYSTVGLWSSQTHESSSWHTWPGAVLRDGKEILFQVYFDHSGVRLSALLPPQ